MDAQALAIAEDVIGVTDLEDFRLALLRALMREVPSDWASLNDLGPDPDECRRAAHPRAAPGPVRIYRPMRVHHQIAFTISSGADRMLAIALSRADPDYTDAERDLLNR